VGGVTRAIWLNARGLGARNDTRHRHQKVDVVKISYFGCIHGCVVPHNLPTAEVLEGLEIAQTLI
jgi:hypothetical protein